MVEHGIDVLGVIGSSPIPRTNPKNMNEFVAKKLGEVLAFARVGTDTFAKGKTALRTVLGEDTYKDCLRENDIHDRSLIDIAEKENTSDITLAKSIATGKKLASMRDLYVGDEWENPTELMEWSGFFEGAAIVHWKLILGIGEALKREELITLATEAINFHQDILKKACDHLQEIGQVKSK